MECIGNIRTNRSDTTQWPSVNVVRMLFDNDFFKVGAVSIAKRGGQATVVTPAPASSFTTAGTSYAARLGGASGTSSTTQSKDPSASSSLASSSPSGRGGKSNKGASAKGGSSGRTRGGGAERKDREKESSRADSSTSPSPSSSSNEQVFVMLTSIFSSKFHFLTV